MPRALLRVSLQLAVGLLASAYSWSHPQGHSVDISGDHSLLLGEIYGDSIYLDVVGSISEGSELAELSSSQLRRLKAYVSRLGKAFDASDAESETSILNVAGQGEISSELHELILACEYWRQQTSDKLSCRNGKLTDYWTTFKDAEELPDRRVARQLARSAINATVEISGVESKKIIFPVEDVQWEFPEFASAFVLDKVDQWIGSSTDLSTFQLRSGETTIVRGSENADWPVVLNAVFHTAAESFDMSAVESAALTQSIPWEKELVAGRRLSGVIDGSTGWPDAKHAALALSDNAFSSRAIALLGAIDDAQPLLDLIEAASESELLLVAEDGRMQQSANMAGFSKESRAALTYRIEYEIPKIDAEPYHRPYLSIWISDEEQQPLRNLLLLGDQERWMQELRVWWRRVGRRNQSVIDGLSGATKRPGQYRLVWDGLDDFGQPIEAQNLILHVEVSRENGGRSYERIPLDLSNLAENVRVDATDEIGEIRVELLNSKLVSTALP